MNVDKIECVEFSKDFVISTLHCALQTVMTESGLSADVSRGQCRDFEDAYHVGQIHILLTVMAAIIFSFENESDKKEVNDLKKMLEIEFAKAQAATETKQ